MSLHFEHDPAGWPRVAVGPRTWLVPRWRGARVVICPAVRKTALLDARTLLDRSLRSELSRFRHVRTTAPRPIASRHGVRGLTAEVAGVGERDEVVEWRSYVVFETAHHLQVVFAQATPARLAAAKAALLALVDLARVDAPPLRVSG